MEEMISPRILTEALEIRKNNMVIPLAGGTDLMVRRRNWSGTLPKFEFPLLYLGNIDELKTIQLIDGSLSIGSAVTLTSLLEDTAIPDCLKKAVREMASPAIRNAGTLGGNICNASPAADTLPPLYAMGASVILQSPTDRRELPIIEFITGPGQTVLQDDELLVEVKIPLIEFNINYYKKVGTRKADALSKLSFTGLAAVANGIIEDVRIALGAVAPRVVRNIEAEKILIGKQGTEIPDLIGRIKEIYNSDIQPIDDQRSNAAYRRMVSLRLIEDFVLSLKETLSLKGN